MKTHYLRTFTETKEFHDLITSSPLKPTITKAEALKLVAEIGSASSKVFKNVVLLVSKHGYIALGFNKPSDCLRKRLPELSNSYISRLLTATDIYLKLDPKLIYLNKVSEATFRPLQDVADKDSVSIWKYVLNHYEKNVKRINSRHIIKAMNALNVDVVNSKPVITISISEEFRPQIQNYVNKISQSIIRPNVNSREEWRQFAKLIYQQLLDQCQFEGSLRQ